MSALLMMCTSVIIIEFIIQSTMTSVIDAYTQGFLSIHSISALFSCVMMTLLEAFTPNNDNLVLPLFGMTIYVASMMLLA